MNKIQTKAINKAYTNNINKTVNIMLCKMSSLIIVICSSRDKWKPMYRDINKSNWTKTDSINYNILLINNILIIITKQNKIRTRTIVPTNATENVRTRSIKKGRKQERRVRKSVLTITTCPLTICITIEKRSKITKDYMVCKPSRAYQGLTGGCHVLVQVPYRLEEVEDILC